MQRLMSIMHNQHKTCLHNQSAAPFSQQRGRSARAFVFPNHSINKVVLLIYWGILNKKGENSCLISHLKALLTSTVNKSLG